MRAAKKLGLCALIGSSIFVAGCDGDATQVDSGENNPSDGGGNPRDGGSNLSDGGSNLSDGGSNLSDGGSNLSDGGTNAGLEEVLGRELYDQFFLHRADSACEGGMFSYDALVAAAATFPAFGNEGSLEVRRREVAAFLANISHETTGGWGTAPDGPYAWGLCFKEEVGCSNGSCTGYCASSAEWPCAAGQTYHGRGPMQLSWNYNYGQAGLALGLDLLNNPNLVTSDGEVSFRTAIWFWMTTQPPKPSSHDVMVGNWTPSTADNAANRVPGFGMTVNIINGGLECNIGSDSRVIDRIGFYLRYTDLLGVSPGPNLDCATMTSY